MAEGEIFKTIERFRRALLTRERQAASEMVRVYGDAWKNIKKQIDILQQEYDLMRERGERPGPAWIYQYDRARAFRDQVERELLAFAQYAEANVREQQLEAIEAAEEHAEELVKRSLQDSGLEVDWNRIDRQAVISLLGMTQKESPLHSLFTEISESGAQKAEDALVQGMILGKNPREVAVDVRKALGTSLSRALTIARTETLRAHREATRESYRVNSSVVNGWVWHAALDERTCITCWVMHGTEHSVNDLLEGHVNCRCAMLPKTPSWDRVASIHDGDKLVVRPGLQEFEDLPDEKKEKILGSRAFQAYKEQKIQPYQLVTYSRSSVWGNSFTHRSILHVEPPALSTTYKIKPVTSWDGLPEAVDEAKRLQTKLFQNDFSNRKAVQLKIEVMRNIAGKIPWEKYADDYLKEFEAFLETQDAPRFTSANTPYEQIVANLIHQWAVTSADSAPLSLALQFAARDLFAPTAFTQHLDLQGGLVPYLKFRDFYYDFLRVMYQNTQALLAKEKITRVPLFRGLTIRVDPPLSTAEVHQIDPKLQPMSSFSLSLKTAESFAAYQKFAGAQSLVLVGDVPRERVLSCPLTGFGCLDEQELVILGAGGDDPDVIGAVDVTRGYLP
jgi:SPP1 gp7 family putative phage head morphogenesis protein